MVTVVILHLKSKPRIRQERDKNLKICAEIYKEESQLFTAVNAPVSEDCGSQLRNENHDKQNRIFTI